MAAHGDKITQVHIGLPGIEALLAHLGLREHGLHLGAIAVLHCGKTQLAGIAHEDKAAGNGVGDLGFLAGFQIGHTLFAGCGILAFFSFGDNLELLAQIL